MEVYEVECYAMDDTGENKPFSGLVLANSFQEADELLIDWLVHERLGYRYTKRITCLGRVRNLPEGGLDIYIPKVDPEVLDG